MNTGATEVATASSPNVTPETAPAQADTNTAAIDDFQKRPDSTKHKFRFDLTLRNSSDRPVTVTNITITFDPDDRGFLSSVIEVSNTYLVVLKTDGPGTVTSRAGEDVVYAWYPNPDGNALIVKTPLQQALTPLSTDRFVVEINFPTGYRFRGPMLKAKLSLTWNGKETSETSVALDP